LLGIARMSEDALSRAMLINGLLAEWQKKVSGESSNNPLRVVELLGANPFITIKGAADKLKIAFTTAQRAVERLERAKIVKRMGDAKRDRVYCATALLDILEEPARLKPAVNIGMYWLYFADQWDAKSPWHDPRVRLAAYLAIDRKTINQAITLGHSRITGSIIPDSFEFYWAPPPPTYDPARAKQLLAAAGYPNGFDAGDYYCDGAYADLGEAVLNNLQEVGIRAKLRPLERAALFKSYAEKSLKNLIQGQSGAFGNAATRLEAFVAKGGAYAYGSYPDIDALFREQAAELDHARREATLHKIQQLVHERTIYAPLWQQAFLNGIGPRVKESGLGLIPSYAYSGPYEDLTLARP